MVWKVWLTRQPRKDFEHLLCPFSENGQTTARKRTGGAGRGLSLPDGRHVRTSNVRPFVLNKESKTANVSPLRKRQRASDADGVEMAMWRGHNNLAARSLAVEYLGA